MASSGLVHGFIQWAFTTFTPEGVRAFLPLFGAFCVLIVDDIVLPGLQWANAATQCIPSAKETMADLPNGITAALEYCESAGVHFSVPNIEGGGSQQRKHASIFITWIVHTTTAAIGLIALWITATGIKRMDTKSQLDVVLAKDELDKGGRSAVVELAWANGWGKRAELGKNLIILVVVFFLGLTMEKILSLTHQVDLCWMTFNVAYENLSILANNYFEFSMFNGTSSYEELPRLNPWPTTVQREFPTNTTCIIQYQTTEANFATFFCYHYLNMIRGAEYQLIVWLWVGACAYAAFAFVVRLAWDVQLCLRKYEEVVLLAMKLNAKRCEAVAIGRKLPLVVWRELSSVAGDKRERFMKFMLADLRESAEEKAELIKHIKEEQYKLSNQQA